MKLYPPEPPEVLWMDSPWHPSSYTLRSPWAIEAWFEPIRWGNAEELLMVNGTYKEPLRGWRFRAKLSTEAVHENDYVLFNEFRKTQKGFYFFPWGSKRPFYWMVKVYGTLYYAKRTAPEAFAVEVDLRGDQIITDFSQLSSEMPGVAVEVSGFEVSPGYWVVKWKPMITVGQIRVTVSDGANQAQSPWVPVLHGRVEFIGLTFTPTTVTLEHDLTPWTREVSV